MRSRIWTFPHGRV